MKNISINGVEITEKMAESIHTLADDGSVTRGFLETLNKTYSFLLSIPDGVPSDKEKFKSEAFDLMANLDFLRSTLKGFIS